MDDIKSVIKYLQAYGLAIENGFERFADAMPILIRQNADKRARLKLHDTHAHYMQNLSVKNKEYLIVVEINPDDWLSNALESGVEPFSMKESLLNSPKAKVSKKGHRFLSIPIGAKKDAKKGTEKGNFYQDKINEVLQKPKFGLSAYKMQLDGTVSERQKVLTDDPQLQGFYRARFFPNQEALQSNSKPKWNFILFRTVSDNPDALSRWEHPGLFPRNILKETERWLNKNIDKIFSEMIQTELDMLNNKMKGK